MRRVQRNGRFLNISSSRSIWDIFRVIHHCRPCRNITKSITHIGDLIHIKPNTREGDLIIEKLHHISPIFRRIRMEVIRKVDRTSPNLTNEVTSLSIFDIDVSLLALLVSITQHSNTGLHDRYILMIFENGSKSIQGEKLCVDCEGLEIMHVIDIAPNGIQGDVVFLEFGDDCFKGCDIFVSPTRLMVSQRPKGRNVGVANKRMKIFE